MIIDTEDQVDRATCRHCSGQFEFDYTEYLDADEHGICGMDPPEECDDCVCFECEERKPVQLWVRNDGLVHQCTKCIRTCAHCDQIPVGDEMLKVFLPEFYGAGQLVCTNCVAEVKAEERANGNKIT